MKNLLLFTTFSIILFSCKKDDVTDNQSVAQKFVANWNVTENVTKTMGTFSANGTFTAPTIKINDSIFACIQTQRMPDPLWVESGPFSADTLRFKPIASPRDLESTFQGNIGTYSQNKDTLQFTYLIGTSSGIYVVKQKWVRL